MSGLRDKPADQQTYREAVAKDVIAGFGRCGGESPEFLAQLALSRADALIAALEGPAATPGPTPDPGLTPTSAALGIECSYCHAAPGEPCRDPGRQVLPYATVHVARLPALHGTEPKPLE